jgi:hypothetical protein
MKTVRYHIEINPAASENSIGSVAEGYAAPNGNVIGTTPKFDGKNDLAVIEVPADEAEWLEQRLDSDEAVVSYR